MSVVYLNRWIGAVAATLGVHGSAATARFATKVQRLTLRIPAQAVCSVSSFPPARRAQKCVEQTRCAAESPALPEWLVSSPGEIGARSLHAAFVSEERTTCLLKHGAAVEGAEVHYPPFQFVCCIYLFYA